MKGGRGWGRGVEGEGGVKGEVECKGGKGWRGRRAGE